MNKPKYKKCASIPCQKTISNGKDNRRKFCNNACRQAAYRARKADRVTLLRA